MFCKSNLTAPNSKLARKKPGCFLREEVREFVTTSSLGQNQETGLYPRACKYVRTHLKAQCVGFYDIQR